MAEHTTNYDLIKPTTIENAFINDINDNMDIIDDQMYQNAQDIQEVDTSVENLQSDVGERPSGETYTLWDKVGALDNNFKVVHLTESGFTFTGDKYFQKAYIVPTGYTIVDIQVNLKNATALSSAMYRDGTINVFAGRWSSSTFIPGASDWAFDLYLLLAKNDIIE